MGKAPGNEEHTVALRVQFHGGMAPEAGRTRPEVYRHVQHLAGDHPHQFGLGMISRLEMQPANYAVMRLALVVLHKPDRPDGFLEDLLVIGFEEIPPGVPEYPGLQDQQAFYIGRDDIHKRSIHFFREAYQCGISTPKTAFTLDLSSTE